MSLTDEELRHMELSIATGSLQKICHEAAQHWWKDNQGNDIRDNPLTFSNKLLLIVTEIAEACEGDRKDLMDDKLPNRKMREVELADALIRICDLAGGYGLDLGGAVADKVAYNSSRIDHTAAHRKAQGGKSY